MEYVFREIAPSPYAIIAAGHAATYLYDCLTAHPGAVERMVSIAPTWRGPFPTVAAGQTLVQMATTHHGCPDPGVGALRHQSEQIRYRPHGQPAHLFRSQLAGRRNSRRARPGDQSRSLPRSRRRHWCPASGLSMARKRPGARGPKWTRSPRGQESKPRSSAREGFLSRPDRPRCSS